MDGECSCAVQRGLRQCLSLDSQIAGNGLDRSDRTEQPAGGAVINRIGDTGIIAGRLYVIRVTERRCFDIEVKAACRRHSDRLRCNQQERNCSEQSAPCGSQYVLRATNALLTFVLAVTPVNARYNHA